MEQGQKGETTLNAINRDYFRRHHGWDNYLDRIDSLYAGAEPCIYAYPGP